MSRALSYINLSAAFLIFLAGIYMVATEHQLLRKLIGINLCTSGALLLAVLTGFIRGGQILADGSRAAANAVVPDMQWLVVVGMVAITAITAVGLALTRSHYRAYGTMDLEEKKDGMRKRMEEPEAEGE